MGIDPNAVPALDSRGSEPIQTSRPSCLKAIVPPSKITVGTGPRVTSRFWPTFARVAAFALLLWLPLLLFEFSTPYSFAHFLLSPVLARAFSFALVVYLSTVSVLSLIVSTTAISLQGRFEPSATFSAVAAAVLLSSSLLLALLLPVHHWAEARGLAPELGALAVAGLTATGGSAAGAGLLWLLPARWLRAASMVGAGVALACWLWSIDRRFQVWDSPDRLAIVLPIAAALIVLVLAPALRRFSQRAGALTVVLTPALAISVALVAVVLRSDTVTRAPHASLPAVISDRPNVLIILVDTLRADHTTTWGYGLDTTPALQRLRAPGATYFANAVASGSSTLPSVKSFFLSQPASFRGEDQASAPPPDGSWTMARAFQASGYLTSALVTNGLIDGPGFQTGFDDFLAFGGQTYFQKSFFLGEVMCGNRSWERFRRAGVLHLYKEAAPSVGALYRDWLARSRWRPFFLYVHLVDPHWPYYDRGFDFVSDEMRRLPNRFDFVDLLMGARPAAGSPLDDLRAREVVARYDSEVRLSDQVIGEMLDDLEHAGLIDSTLVMVVSDHGEEFFEHGGFSHGHDVYEEQVHVPLLIRWPKRREFAAMPERVETPVSLMDVLPTLIDYLQLTPPPQRLFGRSLRPLLENAGEPIGHPVLSEAHLLGKWKRSYREGRLKARLVYSPTVSLSETKDVNVFDLATDPGERSPLPAVDRRVAEVIRRARRPIAQLGGHG
jgi:arylsulfatase A-like enzyme